jgi:hypothetical protein
LVTERFADPIVSLPTDAFRKEERVHLRSTGKIGSPVTIRQPHRANQTISAWQRSQDWFLGLPNPRVSDRTMVDTNNHTA